MSNLTINIDQDSASEFFSHYDPLGPIEKKIWQAAVWWVKRFPCAYPKQEKIAQKVGCRREHVNRAFAKFKKLGWIYLTSRGARRTKIIGIPTHLLMMDLVKREYFKRIEITSKRTHSYSRYKNTTGREGETSFRPFKRLEPSPLGKKFHFSDDGSLKLSLFSEAIQQEALRKAKYLGKDGWRPENQERYLLGMMANMAKKQGQRIDWRSYYKSRA